MIDNLVLKVDRLIYDNKVVVSIDIEGVIVPLIMRCTHNVLYRKVAKKYSMYVERATEQECIKEIIRILKLANLGGKLTKGFTGDYRKKAESVPFYKPSHPCRSEWD